LHCSTNINYTNLFTFCANQADFRHGDFFIEAMRLVLSDGQTPENDKN